MSSRSRQPQYSQVIENVLAPVRNAERIGIGLLHALHPMRSFTEWPAAGLLKPELTQKILTQRSAEIGRNAGVGCCRQPVFPDRHAAIAITVDVVIGVALDAPAGLEHARFDARIGLPAYGSDLNPVAVMIGKAMIEIPPKFKDMPPIHPGAKDRQFYRNAEGLAEDVKYYGEWMRKKAWERIGHLYPQVDLPKEHGGGKATVIAWIWARTVPSPDPAFSDVQVPVTSSFLLSSKAGKEAWIEPIVDKFTKTITYRIRHGGTSGELVKAKEGTKAGQAMFRCLFSDAPISGDYVDKAAAKGRMGVTLLAIVAETRRDRVFVAPPAAEYEETESEVSRLLLDMDFENLEVPCRGTFASNAQGRRYGFNTFKDYFTHRQLVALGTFAELVNEVQAQIIADAVAAGLANDTKPLREGGVGVRGYAEAIAVYLSFGVSRLSDIQNSLCRWESSKTQVRNLFGRQAIPMMWDFGENNVFGDAAGDYRTSLGSIVKVIERFVPISQGSLRNADAQTTDYPRDVVISTDPPYYDNIEYADLSDFFYVWLRKALRYVEPNVLSVLPVARRLRSPVGVNYDGR